MIRVLLLGLSCCGIIGLSQGVDDWSKSLACEDEAPDHISLDLSDMDMRAIRKPISANPKITCLNFAGNKISEIVPNVFEGLSELQYLNLAGNRISNNDLARIMLPKLKTLILDGPVGDSDRRTVLIRYDDIPGEYAPPLWDPRNFGGETNDLAHSFPELKKLSLKNYRGKIGFSRMSITPKLTHLYLTGNNLRAEEVSLLLLNMQTDNLTHLDLNNNAISYTFEPLPQTLQYLSMNENGIETLGSIHPHLFRRLSFKLTGMYNLEYLSLANNLIREIGIGVFDASSNLRFLNLSGNNIDDSSRNAWSPLTNLRNLTLDNNKLSSVPTICELNELRSLSLNKNAITFINQTSFCDLRQLSAIYLNNNNLHTIENETFGHLPALQVLDLSANNIVLLPEYWIAPNNFIIELHLDRNGFTKLDDMSLKRIQGLQYLSIGHNPLKSVTLLSMMSLPNSTAIDISREN